MPTRYKPMKAVSGTLPVGEQWVYELKWDGMRAVTYSNGGAISAHSSQLNDITPRFPELQQLRELFADIDVVVDGELVALGEDGLPSFGRLQARMHLTRAHDIAQRQLEVPVVYVIFDLLCLDGKETIALPYSNRRQLLESLIEPGPSWQLTTVHHDQPQALLAEVTDRGMEGVVAKRKQSHYEVGQRSSDWVKVKPRRRQEFVVGGWVTGEGGRADTIGALLIGYYNKTGLRFAGRVGSGLTAPAIDALAASFAGDTLEVSPFVDSVAPVSGRTIQFVKPTIVVEVAFGQWTNDGVLRHPVYLGRRADAAPEDVVREPDPAARSQP